MTYLGLGTKGAVSPRQEVPKKEPSITHSSSSDEAKRLAAAALSAVKDAAASAAGRGKVEVQTYVSFSKYDNSMYYLS